MAQFKTISIVAHDIDNDFGGAVGYNVWLGSDNTWRSGTSRRYRSQLAYGALGLASTPEKAARIADELNSMTAADPKLNEQTMSVRTQSDTLRGMADAIWEVMRKEHTLSHAARKVLGDIVADIDEMLGPA